MTSTIQKKGPGKRQNPNVYLHERLSKAHEGVNQKAFYPSLKEAMGFSDFDLFWLGVCLVTIPLTLALAAVYYR